VGSVAARAITYLSWDGNKFGHWGDEEGLAFLLASLAGTNPMRLYFIESTARGFNMFHDMYVTARRCTYPASDILWLVARQSALFRLTWEVLFQQNLLGMAREPEEKGMGEGHQRNSMAWTSIRARWLGGDGNSAKASRTRLRCFRKFPPTEDYAFIMSGSNFFSNSRRTDAAKEAPQDRT